MNYCTQCGLKLNLWTIPISFATGVGQVSCPYCCLVFPGTWSTCWNQSCDGYRFCRETNAKDGMYLHHCPICLKSLRQHPMFGNGMDYDLEVEIKRNEWNDMVKNRPLDAAAVYRHHGFIGLSKKMMSKIY